MKNTTRLLLLIATILMWTSLRASDSLDLKIAATKGEAKLELIEHWCANLSDAAELRRYAEMLQDEAKAQQKPYYMGMACHYMGYAQLMEGNTEQSIAWHRKAIKHFNAIDRKDKAARQWLNIGNRFSNVSSYDSAIACFNRCSILAIEAGDAAAANGALLNISTVYNELGEVEKELEYLLKGYAVAQRLKDKSQMALITFNLSVFYMGRDQRAEALKHARSALELYKTNNYPTGIGGVYNLFAEFHARENNSDSVFHYLRLAKEQFMLAGDGNRIAVTLMSEAIQWGKIGQYSEALKLNAEALKIFEEQGDMLYYAKAMKHDAEFHQKRNQLDKSIEKMLTALEIFVALNARADVIEGYGFLAQLYDDKGQHKQAYLALRKHLAYKDSLDSDNNKNVIAKMEAKYQNEKKQLEIENLEKASALQQSETKRERNQKFFVLAGLVLALLMVALVGVALINKKRDNRIIAAQKQEVEKSRDEVQFQKDQVEEKNREITDSITYARRIQGAILPTRKTVTSNIKNSFILYKPKDIVAGDFYWLERVGDTVIFAAADCTGHGVPGALVSVVCHNALNRSVREYGLTEPALILNKCRDIVVEQFEQSDEDVRDGMDIAICSLNLVTNELQYAGAQNPLWIVSSRADLQTDAMILYKSESEENQNIKLFEIKPDKQPIGKFSHSVPFTNHRIQLMKGDSVYIFSDGYADQFGGPKGKKFKYSTLKELMLSMNQLTMTEQHIRLNSELEAWRGGMEQIDDINIIGVRI